jgi:hypothetical protein
MALLAIIFLYVGVGVLTAIGSITISSKYFSPKAEQIFYGLMLAPIALIYLAFVAHYTAVDARQLEVRAALLFAATGLFGIRLAPLLMLGYAAHGFWDLAHELSFHQGTGGVATFVLTPIPLAYGAFCAAYDWVMAGYFYTRRHAWQVAWRAN